MKYHLEKVIFIHIFKFHSEVFFFKFFLAFPCYFHSLIRKFIHEHSISPLHNLWNYLKETLEI